MHRRGPETTRRLLHLGDGKTRPGGVRAGDYFSDVRFESLQGSVAPEILRAIKEKMNFEYMTKVQAATLPTILAGDDV